MTWDDAINRIFDERRYYAWDARVNACIWMLKHKDEFDCPEHGLHCAFRVLQKSNLWGKILRRRNRFNEIKAMEKYYDYLTANTPTPKPYYGNETIFDWIDEVLDPKDAELIRLKFEKCLSHREIAKMEGVTPQAISLRYIKAMKNLRRVMK